MRSRSRKGAGEASTHPDCLKKTINTVNLLVTGHARFIGSNIVHRPFHDMKEGTIVGIDNLNDYYDPMLKINRLDELDKHKPSGINH